MNQRPWYDRNPMKASFAVVLLLLMMWMGKQVIINIDAFNPLKVALSQFHFSDIYLYRHGGDNSDVDTDMILVDIHNLKERNEVATLIDSINAHNPRVVAMDIIMQKKEEPYADSHLVAALGECSRLVLAKNITTRMDGTRREERSFFSDCLLEKANHQHRIVEGRVDYLPVSVVRTAESWSDSVPPTFAAQVAMLATGKTVLPSSRMIDFGDSLMCWHVGETLDLSALEDKIVFLGDKEDLRDWYNIPVSSGGKSRMSGLEIHARSAAALISPNPYHTLPWWLEVLLQVVVLFLFFKLLYVLPQQLGNWVQGVLQIVFMLLMLPICYWMYLGLHIVCSPATAIVGFGMAGFAKDIVDFVVLKLKKS